MIGLEFNVNSLWSILPMFASLLAIAISAKIIGGYIGARVTKFSHTQSLVIGILMNGRGMVDLAIVSVGFTAGILDEKLFSIAFAIGFVTTILTPIITRPLITKLDLQKSQSLKEELNAKYRPSNLSEIVKNLESGILRNKNSIILK